MAIEENWAAILIIIELQSQTNEYLTKLLNLDSYQKYYFLNSARNT